MSSRTIGSNGEERFQALGRIDGVIHVLIFTPRGAAIRAISLRKADKDERAEYLATGL